MKRRSTKDIIRETFIDFSRNTSIHGFRYTVNSEISIWEKTFWALVICCVSSLAFYLAALHLKRFSDDPLRSTIVTNYAPTTSVPFPAVTICHTNRILESKMHSFISKLDLEDDDEELLFRAIPQLMGFFRFARINETDLTRLKKILDRNDYLNIDLVLRKMGSNCNEILIQCKLNEELVDCMSIFEERYTLDGLCCSFNYIHGSRKLLMYNIIHRRKIKSSNNRFKNSFRNGISNGSHFFYETQQYVEFHEEANLPGYFRGGSKKSKPYRSLFTGWHSGLTLTMNPMLQRFEHTTIHSSGIKAHIHNPFEHPAYGTISKVASPGNTYYFQIMATKLINTEKVRDLTPDKRQCVFSNENRLTYHKHYYFSNCMVENFANHLHEMCRCVLFFHSFSDKPKCNITDINCIQNYYKEYGITANSAEWNCPARCDIVLYRVHSTNTILNNVSQALTEENKNKIPDREGIRVNLFFINAHTIMSRDVYTTNLNLIASIGGIYGLFMGCSIITILEMVYYCSLRVLINFGWLNRSSKMLKGKTKRRLSIIRKDRTLNSVYIKKQTSNFPLM